MFFFQAGCTLGISKAGPPAWTTKPTEASDLDIYNDNDIDIYSNNDNKNNDHENVETVKKQIPENKQSIQLSCCGRFDLTT